jgi:hypothetical protein
MKNKTGQAAMTFVSPPAGTQTTSERLAMAANSIPSFHVPEWARKHDKRADLAPGLEWQRLRARQMQPRTAIDSHVRVPRRPQEM